MSWGPDGLDKIITWKVGLVILFLLAVVLVGRSCL
jgi:hypothetical protein